MKLKHMFKTKIKSSRMLLYICVMVWVMAFNIYVYFYHGQNITDTINKIIDTSKSQYTSDEDAWNSFTKQDFEYKPLNTSILDSTPLKLYQSEYLNDTRNIKPTFSSNYETMFFLDDEHDVSNLDFTAIFNSLDFPSRCQLYFENLFIHNQNWLINPNEGLLPNRFDYDFLTWRRHNFLRLEDSYKQLHGMNRVDKIQDSDDFNNYTKMKFNQFWQQQMKYEQIMLDSLSHLRIFNKCYITSNQIKQQREVKKFINEQEQFAKTISKIENTNDNNSNDYKFKLLANSKKKSFNFDPASHCSNVEQRLYPWLSFHFPVFEKWTGKIELVPPKFQNSHAAKSNPSSSSSYESCFLNRFKSSLSGKGIVLTVADQHVEDTINLIALLRALSNMLPIQIVYYDNLSGESKSRIVKAAREVMKTFPESFENVRHQFPQGYDQGLPKQEIYFVNTYNVIHENFKDKFNKYGNKLLATVFNSFEEFLLIDADSVLLKNPEWFFQNNKYQKSGALFYKDRTSMEIRPPDDMYLFKKMTPSTFDAMIFDFPLITSKTLSLEAMTGIYHFMEAGVVAIDKVRHFNSILLLPQLNFMEPFRVRSHGEKEFFWLAFVINGDEDFEFNQYHAGAAGQFSSGKIKINGELQKAQEICSAHPAHVDDETNELVWFNSGFHFCGKFDKVDYSKDLEKQGGRYRAGITTVDELKAYYFGPLQVQSVIIPPFKSVREMILQNKDAEPSRAWQMVGDLCNGYVWCAYSSIGSGDNVQTGTLINFDEQTQQLFQYYGDVWVGNE